MFGYVTVREDELKVKEYREYKSFYCGLCHTLGKRHGLKGRMTLNFDMVFLAMLLTGLYEPETKRAMRHCIVHPVEKHPTSENEILEYVADMNILLTYHSLYDGWMDDRNLLKKSGADLLGRRYRKVAKRYPEKDAVIRESLKRLHEIEKADGENLDAAADTTGEMMQAIFTRFEDHWSKPLGNLGFFLGKFVYLADAYDDLDRDRKSGNYNVWKHYCDRADFEKLVQETMELNLAEATRQFEMLPILLYEDILRNILYSGVFVKLERRAEERKEEHA